MQDTQFSASDLSFILALTINKEVIKAEGSFLKVKDICLYNNQFFDSYST